MRTTIIERDYGDIHVGQAAAVVVDAFPDQQFHGTVARIAPMLEESSRVAQMEIEVLNESLTLKPGMFAKVHVVLKEKDSARVVPSEAVVRRNGENGIFVVEKDSATQKLVARYYPIETGITTLDRTELLKPEIEGQVVTLGHHLLDDGSVLILTDTGANSSGGGTSGETGQ